MTLLEIYAATHLTCAFFAYGFLFGEMDTPEFRAAIEAEHGEMTDSKDYWSSMSASFALAILFGPLALAMADHKTFKLL